MCNAVIKPIFGAASIGVVRVNSEEQLRTTYRKVVREMAAARIVDGALEQGAAAAEAVQEDGIIDQVPPSPPSPPKHD